MPVFKAQLSVSSLGDLVSALKAYREKVSAAPGKMVQALTKFGEEQISRGLDDIVDKDGNYLAAAGSEQSGAKGLAYMQGEQAAFLEFGTGVEGRDSPHPQAGEAGWGYGSGAAISSAGDWFYWDSVKERYIHTQGIPAQMPVFKAANAIRQKESQAAKEALT